MVVYAGEGEDAGDVEDCRPHGKHEGSQEADFVEVVRCEFVPGGPPFPATAGGGVLEMQGGGFVQALGMVMGAGFGGDFGAGGGIGVVVG